MAHDANPHGAGKCEKQVGEEPTLPKKLMAEMVLEGLGFEFDNQSFFSRDGTWWNMMFFFVFLRSDPLVFPHRDLRILLSRLHIHCESVLFLCEALHRLLFELHPLSRAHHPWGPETRTCLALPCLIFAAFVSLHHAEISIEHVYLSLFNIVGF